MPKYLFHGSYTADGLKGVLKEGGVSRRDTIDKIVTGMGGSVEAFYYAFGGDDIYVIVDLPDQDTAIAMTLTVNAAGGAAIKTTVLISPEEADEAIKKSINYRPPGQ